MKKETLLTLILIGLSTISHSQTIFKQPKQKIKILLLGTYHFANPGADKFNVEVDDYMSDIRQKEISDVNSSLARFKPQKIFIESGIKWQTDADTFFQQYKQGKVDINQKGMVNEKFQIGLKLGKQLNNEHIYSVDAPGDWFESKVKKYADSVGMTSYADFEKETKMHVDSLNIYFKHHTVKENLYYLNSTEEQLTKNHFMYNYIFPRVGAGDNYIGPDLVGEWYKRNLRIYGNILKNVSLTDKTILLIFGNGHIHILRQLFIDNPDFEVVDTRLYLK